MLVNPALCRWICCFTLGFALAGRASADGSAEFDTRDASYGGNPHDQQLDADTPTFVDILNNTGDFSTGNEKICWTGSGSLNVYAVGANPWTATPVAIATLTSGNCTSALATVGAYAVKPSVDDQTAGTRWDVRVCDADDTCAADSVNERTGRLWSTRWLFETGATNYAQSRANNGSVYAVVPGGDVGRDAVIEMTLDGLSGADYALYANSIGPQIAATDVRVGRSTPRNATYEVIPQYRLYLNPPESAQYNWITPVVSAVTLTPACGTAVVLDTAAGSISFSSNVVGQYVVICDVNKDSIYDFANTADFSAFGAAVIGTNTVSWNGKNNANVNAAAGTYNCAIRLNVGEFHYVGEDIETSYPGFRMFRVEPNKTTRTGIRMFWDDALVTSTQTMTNGFVSPNSPQPNGLDPLTYATAAAAYHINMATPTGNARAWGSFTGTGTVKGNNVYLDTFGAADSVQSPAFQIDVITAAGDADVDTLTNARECALGADPQDADTDGDGVNDGYEATSSTALSTDSDGILDILDPDDDGDGVSTLAELGETVVDGNPVDAANSDSTGGLDYLDTDSDDDGVLDGTDPARTNNAICRDLDVDACDDCAVVHTGGGSTVNDGLDTDGDVACNVGDPDDDNDGVPDGSDSDPISSSSCQDVDSDGCNDCAVVQTLGGDSNNDGTDTDGDGLCDGSGLVGDQDDDNDGVADAADSARLDNTRCRDADGDGCDDCAVVHTSGGSVSNDGMDSDGDGACNGSGSSGDPDDDNDGVADAADSAPLDNTQCRDADADSCDDCAVVHTGGGSVGNDGTDTDGDGACNGSGVNGDQDDDGDGVNDAVDVAPLDNTRCRDVDSDSCDDCAVVHTGGGSVSNDGTDTDSDGACNGSGNSGDPDDDNDGVADAADSAPLDNTQCRDTDADSCDDCAVVHTGGGSAGNDGTDTDGDGACNGSGSSGDPDDDNDGVADGADIAPLDNTRCRDLDNDTCDDCAIVHSGGGSTSNDGTDPNSDGVCDVDADLDGDGIADSVDLDIDNDGIPNSSEGDGDKDGDGVVNTRDLDADGDGIPDVLEAGGGNLDADGDGRIDDVVDANDDGLHDPLQASRGALPLPDSDKDGAQDFLDLDADGDGISDAIESDSGDLDADGDGRIDSATDANGNGLADVVDASADLTKPGMAVSPPDTDADGAPDFRDTDSDDDGVLDAVEGHDVDGDGASDVTPQADADADGLDDAYLGGAALPDHDGDGLADFRDPDDDGDTVLTSRELDDAEMFGDDVDGDGLPNYLDTDADADGYGDDQETQGDGDLNADAVPDYLQAWVYDDDTDGDGLLDFVENPDGDPIDSDGDGKPDYMDPDDDGDGVPTADERPKGMSTDTDGDGKLDHLDVDDDGDGILTEDEIDDGTDQDSDDDGTPDRLDTDDDGDGLPTVQERTDDGADQDIDGDGRPDHLDTDDDGDGVLTQAELDDAGAEQDSDGDGKPDHLDVDDDGDGIPTKQEFGDGADFGNDVDGDGIPNYLDLDSDGDGVRDTEEAEIDFDDDGVPDYLEPPPGGGFAGGALCAASGIGGGNGANLMTAFFLLAGVLLTQRRRRR